MPYQCELRRKSDLCMKAAKAANDPVIAFIWAKHAYTLATKALRVERGWYRLMRDLGAMN